MKMQTHEKDDEVDGRWQVSVMLDSAGRYMMSDALSLDEAQELMDEVMDCVEHGEMVRLTEDSAVAGTHVVTVKIVPFVPYKTQTRDGE